MPDRQVSTCSSLTVTPECYSKVLYAYQGTHKLSLLHCFVYTVTLHKPEVKNIVLLYIKPYIMFPFLFYLFARGVLLYVLYIIPTFKV